MTTPPRTPEPSVFPRPRLRYRKPAPSPLAKQAARMAVERGILGWDSEAKLARLIDAAAEELAADEAMAAPEHSDPRSALAYLVNRCRSEGVGTSWDPLRHAEDVLREGE